MEWGEITVFQRNEANFSRYLMYGKTTSAMSSDGMQSFQKYNPTIARNASRV